MTEIESTLEICRLRIYGTVTRLHLAANLQMDAIGAVSRNLLNSTKLSKTK